MTRSATWWLVAAAIAAGLVGVVLKASDFLDSGAPSRSGAALPDRLARSDARHEAVHEAAMDRREPAPALPRSAANPPEERDGDDVPPGLPDVLGSAPARNPDGVGRTRSGGAMGSHRQARQRSGSRRRTEGASLHAGAVGGEPDAAPERPATGSTRTAAQPAGAVAATAAEPAVPDVAPASDVSFTSGADRQFPTDTPVEVADVPDIAGASGTLSFWLQPTWEGGNQDDASLLELGDGRLRIVKNVDFLRFEWMDDAGASGGIGAPIVEWKPGEWHAVTTTWNGNAYALYIDGRLVSEKADAGRVGLPKDATLVIGSDFAEARPVAPGVIGNVDVRRRPLTPAEVANQFAAVNGSGRR